MASKKALPQHPNITDPDYFVLGGVQRREVHYVGSEKYPSTWETEPYFEFSCKERKKYPVTIYTNPNSSRNILTAHSKHLQASKITDCHVQNLGDCGNNMPDTQEMGEIFRKIEKYTSSLKSKFTTQKENERSSSKVESTREEPVMSFGSASSRPGDHNESTSDSSDDEITSLSSSLEPEENEELVQENERNTSESEHVRGKYKITEVSEENEKVVQESERSTSKSEPARRKYGINPDLDALPPGDLNDSTTMHLHISESSSDEESEESVETGQETPEYRKDQSSGSSSEDSSDSSIMECDA